MRPLARTDTCMLVLALAPKRMLACSLVHEPLLYSITRNPKSLFRRRRKAIILGLRKKEEEKEEVEEKAMAKTNSNHFGTPEV